MIVRIGIHPSPRYGAALVAAGGAGLISANALRKRSGAFRSLSADPFGGLNDVALDSAGFVAMMRYGGYPWSAESYVKFAASWPWAWWASMDLCCEPQIAKSPEIVRQRIDETVRRYGECIDLAAKCGAPPPMPVLQGWRAEDYLDCARRMAPLPQLVGLGSVCRRDLGTTTGVRAIVAALGKELPPHVKLHLFGVKGQAIECFLGHPRIASVDSMAWDYAARRELEMPRTVTKKIAYMVAWRERQTSHVNLFRSAA